MAVWIPFTVLTAFWATVGLGGPWVVPKGPNQGEFSKILFPLNELTIAQASSE